MIKKKIMRFHQETLADSLATQREVSGLAELREKFAAIYKSATNIRIKKECYPDNRLPEEWGGIFYYVVCDHDGYKGQCIGMCNFYEE
jgi:hypothetical protein